MISDNGRSSGVVQSGRTRPSPQGRATSSFSSSPSSTTNDFPNGPRSTTKTTQSSTASSSSTAATAPTSSRPQAILLSSVVPSGDFCVLCAHSTTNYHIASLSSASASTISASSSLGTLDQPQPVQQTPPRRQGCDHHTGSMYPPYNRAPSDSQVLTKRCPYHHQKVSLQTTMFFFFVSKSIISIVFCLRQQNSQEVLIFACRQHNLQAVLFFVCEKNPLD